MVQNPPLEREYDLVIVGSGGGSMAAALAAKKLGKSVVILEKMDKVGGSTSFSGGVWWVPGNHLLAEQGIPDSFDKAREYFDSVVTYKGPGVTARRRDAFLKAAPRVIRFLCDLGLKVRRPHDDWPDYYDNLPGGLPQGRSLMADHFNLKDLGPWQEHLAMYPPSYGVPIGADEFPTLFLLKRTMAGKLKALRFAMLMIRDKLLGRVTVANGAAIQGRMLQIALREAVPILRNTPVTGLVVEDGAVVGVEALCDGAKTTVRARHGVICNVGGYSRGYFDMRFAGHAGYSQAEHHAGRGIVTIAVDHLGVGDSTTRDGAEIQFEDLAATYHACVGEVLALLGAGGVAGLEPIVPAAVIGIGQSMGGCVSIVTQARHASFDGIGVLGYSAIHTRLPQRDAEQEAANAREIAGIARGTTGRGAANTLMQDHVYPFHFEDVPAEIVQADMAGGYPVRQSSPPFGSMTIPDCAVQMLLPGVVAAEAAAVRVPVFVGNGARDVCPDPRAEPGAYAQAPEIVTAIFARMAHMHNFASSRAVMWDRLASWYESVARMKAKGSKEA